MYNNFGKSQVNNRQSGNFKNRFRRGRGFGMRQKYINPALFVKKAEEQEIQEAFTPKHEFADFNICSELKQNIKDHGYITPTPIQDEAIPYLLESKDLVGIANTGTGKTAAFLIALINKVFLDRFQKVLIIAPTRELAVQIEDEFKAFAKNMNIFSVLCIGGVGMHGQVSGLRRNHNFVIGTPGRLKDLKEQRKLNLAMYNNIVLDEVDRMLDMGFVNDVKFIISHLPLYRQSLFFSATITKEVAPIMHTLLKNPVTVSVKQQETAINVDQDVIRLQGRNKIDVLCELLGKQGFGKVLIFGRTKWGMEKLGRVLLQKGLKIAAIHGNKNQNQRQRALDEFKKGAIQALLATDIASRGLDIEDVTHVINYDQPASYEDYIHRIGRTGRAGKTGSAITFLD